MSIAGSNLAAAIFVLVANKISSAEGKRARISCDAADASNVSPKAGLKSRPIRRWMLWICLPAPEAGEYIEHGYSQEEIEKPVCYFAPLHYSLLNSALLRFG